MNMRNHEISRLKREAAIGKRLIAVAALILFAGLFLQITMLSHLTKVNKQSAALEQEIAELNASVDNMERSISNYHNLANIEYRARQLGMQLPDADQIRTVRIDLPSENTSAQ